MGLTRHHRPLGSLLAVALVLGAGYLPAAAQSGSEAVVCVGSETRTLQTNPIRRVYTEDMEIVYRIGVDIGQRDEWTYSAMGGQDIVVTMESDEVDAYLLVLRNDGSEVARDDGGGSDRIAQVELQAPVAGRYTILATSYDSEKQGRYTIRVDRPAGGNEVTPMPVPPGNV